MNGNMKLASPPVVEVVCGLFFAPIAELDPIAVGKLWHDLRNEYPQHAVQPPVADQVGVSFNLGTGPLRTWFISANDEYVIQIQQDRFYLNWRKRDGGYPRFNDYGDEKGVMSRTLSEFERFSTFCDETFGARPAVGRVEVAKVDLLMQGVHWQDAADLTKLMPVVQTLRAHSKSEDVDLSIRFAESRPAGEFILAVHCGMQSIFGTMPARGVRIETRIHRAIAANSDAREQLGPLNAELNEAFFGLFDSKELSRFGGVS